MFRCATFLFAVAKVYLFLHSANFSLFFFEEQSKILGSTGKSGLAGELDNYMRNNCPLDFFSTTDWTDWTDGTCVEDIDQKVSGGLGGVPPWAFRHRSLLKTRLGSSPMT